MIIILIMMTKLNFIVHKPPLKNYAHKNLSILLKPPGHPSSTSVISIWLCVFPSSTHFPSPHSSSLLFSFSGTPKNILGDILATSEMWIPLRTLLILQPFHGVAVLSMKYQTRKLSNCLLCNLMLFPEQFLPISIKTFSNPKVMAAMIASNISLCYDHKRDPSDCTSFLEELACGSLALSIAGLSTGLVIFIPL